MSDQHNELIRIGANWLRSNDYTVILAEQRVGRLFGEEPDLFAWQDDPAITCKIECKVTKADFHADAKKASRQKWFGIGVYRWYLAPPDIIPVAALPPKWGLLEVGAGVCAVAVQRPTANIQLDRSMETRLLLRAHARLLKKTRETISGAEEHRMTPGAVSRYLQLAYTKLKDDRPVHWRIAHLRRWCGQHPFKSDADAQKHIVESLMAREDCHIKVEGGITYVWCGEEMDAFSLKTAHDPFDEFWDVVPKKVGKAAAKRAYTKAQGKVDPDTVLRKMTEYAAAVKAWPKGEFQYILHPATWLNGEHWTDDPASWTRTAAAGVRQQGGRQGGQLTGGE